MSTRSDRYAFYTSPNPLPTPAPSDSSRNTSPHSGYRRSFEILEPADANSAPNLASLAYGSSSDMFSISSHEIPLDAPSSDRTNAFFTSQSTNYKLPTPPRRSATLSPRASRDSQLSDKSANLTRSRSERRTSPPRSSTENFFFTGPRTPSPPPPLRPSAPNGSTISIPPLSRFFPSRYRRARDALDDSTSFPSPSPNASTQTFSSPPLSPQPDRSPAHFPVDTQLASTQVHYEQAPPANTSHQPEEGECYQSDDIKLTYLQCIGKGAFSSVWLARDDSGGFSHDQQPHERRPSESVAGRPRDKKMDGLKPTHPGATLSFSTLRFSTLPLVSQLNDQIRDGSPGSALVDDGVLNLDDVSKPGRLVAVKMMDIAVCDANDRTRISFVREVEVLRHISHPNIVSYLHSFTTPEHHCLVLEYIEGRELFELVNSSEKFSRMTEELIRRMWGELALAVGWMHNVALVHRDIKLENIMLTCDPFAYPSNPIDIHNLPSPLVKLTDFGLARFIDPTNPLLTTRCGSEYYSAPEIIMAQPYDGRRTDAWACGVVLFALATRALPFDADVSRFSYGALGEETCSKPKKDSKRSYMLRIAKGEYHWPGETYLRRSPSGASATSSRRSSLTSSDEGHHPLYWPSPSFNHVMSLTTSPSGSVNGDAPRSQHSTSAEGHMGDEVELHANPNVLVTEGIKRVVAKLLVRDPRKRWRIVDLWADEWMRGPGAPLPPPEALLEDQTPSAEEPMSPVQAEKDSDGDWMPIYHSHRRSASGRLILAHGDTIPIVARQEIAMQ